MTRFDLDMDGTMVPCEEGQWVRYEDAITVTEAMVVAADAAVPYLPAEIHRRQPAIRKMLEAAIG